MKRILVVDDSSFVRSIMRRMLEGSEYTVVAEAADAKEAIELYAMHRPDVVMLDLTLPGATVSAPSRRSRRRIPPRASSS